MNSNVRSTVTLVCRLGLGAIFVYASWDKILHPFVFSANIDAYEILPKRFLYIAAIGIPWVEMVCGGMLIIGVWTRSASLLIGGMLLGFMAGIARALILDLDISCGCFTTGTEGDRVGWPRILEDGLMFGAAAWIFFFPESRLSLWDGEAKPVH